MMINERQHEVIQWAKAIVQQEPLILDTETTGLKEGAEICQIAIVSLSGAVLLDQLIKPKLPIPPDATRIHGITNAMVEDAPDWKTLRHTVAMTLINKDVIVYHAAYDLRMIRQSDARHNFNGSAWESDQRRWHCAMERYAEYWGDWNDYRGNFKWQTLINALAQQHIPEPDAPAHSALGDCLRTLALVKYLASREG
jgi:DNA polymerase-3 subunit epsilon